MSILDIQQLSVTLNQTKGKPHTLLNQVSCQVKAGEIVAVVGPNGAGKSTLLKALAGDLSPNQFNLTGNITIHGLADKPTLRARQIAVLPQFSLLNFPYQVHEVVALGRIPHSSGKQIDNDIIDAALAAMDIGFLKHRAYTELSGGEKQRVQLARVLAQIWRAEDAPAETRLLLLDEPTTALDLGHQKQLMQSIKHFAQQGVAVIMIAHDINLAAHYADQVLALCCSEMIAYGAPKTVITTDTIDRLFNIQVEVMLHPVYHTPVVLGI